MDYRQRQGRCPSSQPARQASALRAAPKQNVGWKRHHPAWLALHPSSWLGSTKKKKKMFPLKGSHDRRGMPSRRRNSNHVLGANPIASFSKLVGWPEEEQPPRGGTPYPSGWGNLAGSQPCMHIA